MVPILDMHADLFMDLTRRAELYRSNNGGKTPPPELGTRHLQRMKAGGIVGAVITDCRMAGESSEPMHLEQFINTVQRELKQDNEAILHVLSAADLVHAIDTGVFAAIVGYEGLSPTKGNLDWIVRLYNEAGLRVAIITHNDDNDFGGGLKGIKGARNDSLALGLTEKGRQVVALMNQLGILIDMSHAGRATQADILTISKRPVMISHVLSKEIYDNGRNLSAEEARKIADAGGLIGCMTSPAALAPIKDRDNHTLSRYVAHLLSLISSAGIDHIGLGMHFCEYLYPPEVYPPVVGLEDASASQNIIQALLDAGLGPEAVEKIAWKNFLRLFKETVG
jgi:membrane dipeptidase